MILLSFAFAGLAFNIIFRKKGKFPAYRVGHNSNMKKIGITCVKHEEIRCHRKNMKDQTSCESCG
jgi:hypothetical protein